MDTENMYSMQQYEIPCYITETTQPMKQILLNANMKSYMIYHVVTCQ